VTKPIKEKPWCSLRKINTHSSESCWVLHPELRPSYLKEHWAAQSARHAKVVPAKLGSSLSVKPKPALLSATKDSPRGVKQTMDSYYAEVVIDKSPYHEVKPFCSERESGNHIEEVCRYSLRQVTQADMPLSYLPYPDASREQHPPNKEPAPSVQQDELESYTPRQFQSAGGDNTRRGRNVVDQDLLDANNLNHHSNRESDNEEMPKSFGYLSEGDPNFQGALEFVMEKQLPRSSSVLRNGSKKEKASDHEGSGEQSGTPQEGRPLESSDDESTREILKTLSSGDNISLTNNAHPPAEDIPGASLTRENVSTGTRCMRKDDLPEEGEIIGEKHQDGESKLSGQQSNFDKSMPGTTFETVVCRDQMIEPVLHSNAFGRVSHIRDLAPMEWSDQDRKKYHQPELQALMGGPMPVDI
jgi:hypothetical protein